MGESVPKPRPKGVGNGKQVNIPAPLWKALKQAGTEKGMPSQRMVVLVQACRQIS